MSSDFHWYWWKFINTMNVTMILELDAWEYLKSADLMSQYIIVLYTGNVWGNIDKTCFLSFFYFLNCHFFQLSCFIWIWLFIFQRYFLSVCLCDIIRETNTKQGEEMGERKTMLWSACRSFSDSQIFHKERAPFTASAVG